MNLTVQGDLVFKSVRLAATRSSRSLYFEHNKLVLIGEKLARSDYFTDVMDLLLRDREMRRRMKIVVVQGKAKDALDIHSPQENLTTQYLDSLTKNNLRTGRMPADMPIGDLSEKLIGKMSFITQRLIPYENEGKMIGSAVFHGHDHKMVGWLTGQETEALLWLTGKLKGGVTVGTLPNGDRIAYEIRTVDTKIIPKVRQGKFEFDIKIQSEGSLGESWAHRDALDKKFVNEVEKATEQEIQRITRDVIQKLQKQLGVDVIGLGDTLSRKEPKVWEQVKNDWDHGKNYFRDAKINVDVEATVRFQGVITQIK
jgi:spore germination protein